MSYVLGIDLGTSSLKGLLVDKNGRVVQIAQSDYPLITPKPGFSEQNPEEWVSAFFIVFEELIKAVPDLKEKLEGISFSGQMHSLVLLDQDAKVLRNAILWNDVRTTSQCKEIMAKYGDRLIKISKNIALEGFTLPKILWVRENEPEVYAKIAHILLPKDYLRLKLTGEYNMDLSDAAGTLLLDEEKKVWSAETCNKFDIDMNFLPELVESIEKVGNLKGDIRDNYGLDHDIAIFGGGADNACAAIGAGILDAQTGMASIGTSGVFLSGENGISNYDGKLHLFNHGIPGSYYSMGVTLAAGSSLNWFRDTFAEGVDFKTFLNGIEDVPIGSSGLIFTPYISGERTPYADSEIRGSFIGMDIRHKDANFKRAVLEGITYSLNDSKIIMEQVADKSFTRIVSVGGGSKNPVWLQMQADIFNCEVVALTAEQGPGLGAAMMAAVGLGWFSDFSACKDVFVEYTAPVKPIMQNVEKYKKYYEIYNDVYSKTAELCHRMAALED